MVEVVVAGLFGLAPLLVLYASSRERRLRLMRAEIEVLKGLREIERSHSALEMLLDERLQDYIAVERARSDPRAQASIWRKRGWVWASLAYATTALYLVFLVGFPDEPQEVRNAVTALVMVVVLIAGAGFFYTLWRQGRGVRAVRATSRSAKPDDEGKGI